MKPKPQSRASFLQAHLQRRKFLDSAYRQFAETILLCSSLGNYLLREAAAEMDLTNFEQDFIQGATQRKKYTLDSKKYLTTDIRLPVLARFYDFGMTDSHRNLFRNLFINHIEPAEDCTDEIVELLQAIETHLDLMLTSRQFVKGFHRLFNDKFRGISFSTLRGDQQ